MLLNHKNLCFTRIPDKTNDMIFLKSPKTLFLGHFLPFLVIFVRWEFFQKNLALSHTIIYGPLTPWYVSEKVSPRKDERKDRQADPISYCPSRYGQGAKKKIHNSSKTMSSTSLNNNYFKIFTSILLNCYFKISKIYLTQRVFSYEFTDTRKIRK